MKRPPNIVITLLVAAATFGLIVLVKSLLAPAAPGAWLTDEASAFERARAQNKGVVIDFTAQWAVQSVELSRMLDGLRAELDRDFVALRIDITNDTMATEEMRQRYGARTVPSVIFVDSDGRLLGAVTTLPDDRELREAARLAAARR